MKSITLVHFFLCMLIVGISCSKKKEEFYDTTKKGAYLTLVSVKNTLDPNVASNKVTQVVKSVGEPVKTVKIYAATSPTLDKTQWKLVKSVPFSGETTLTVSVTELATALGISDPATNMTPGSVYSLYNEVVLEDGRTFSLINTSGADLENQPAFNVAFRWQAIVVCPPFNLADHYNDVVYEIVEDQWEDLFPGDLVLVKLGANPDEIVLVDVYPTAYDHKDMVIKIDKSNGLATVARYTYGGYSLAGARYTAATAGSVNFAFPCKDIIDIKVNHRSTGGTNYGDFRLVLKKY